MVNKLIGFMAGIVFFSLPILLNVQAFAAPSVKDCMENADCEELDDGTTEQKDVHDKTDNSEEAKPSLIKNIFKMVFALIIVIGLIYVLLKFLNKRNKLFSNVKTMENLGGISVGTNKSLQLVRIGSRVYVIGVGDNVDMLQEVTDEQVKQELLKQNDTTASGNGIFPTWFSGSKNETESDESTETDGFKERLSQELANLKKTRKRVIRQDSEKGDIDE